MEHYEEVYSSQADAYHQLIAAEDVDGQLLAALERVTRLRGVRLLDLGTGTGRLPLLLADHGAQIVGLDLHHDMLRQNMVQRQQLGGRWQLVQGDIRHLPFPNDWADVVTAGWAIGHMLRWFGDDWQAQIGRALDEMHRVVAPGGSLIVIETLSTGSVTPTPPSEGHAEYYAWREERWGFSRQTIQTDYQFASVDEAVARTEFFFGAAMADRIRAEGWARLPEWTGVWSKRT